MRVMIQTEQLLEKTRYDMGDSEETRTRLAEVAAGWGSGDGQSVRIEGDPARPWRVQGYAYGVLVIDSRVRLLPVAYGEVVGKSWSAFRPCLLQNRFKLLGDWQGHALLGGYDYEVTNWDANGYYHTRLTYTRDGLPTGTTSTISVRHGW